MRYSEFGNTGVQVSALGFGAMRLPMLEKDGSKAVDMEKAVPVMQRAFELGVNYIDTAPYYCEKQSEIAVGKALKGWRDKVFLSTKNPIEDASGAHFTERLERSLRNLDVEHIDFYHMWGISLETFKNSVMATDGPMQAAMRAKEEGLIKHISFSFHDKAENFTEIAGSGYFESVLMQYNLLDRSNEDNIKFAREKGLGVVIMGPVGGGRLGAPSPAILSLMKGKSKSTAETAMRFVLSNPGVNIALSGMGTLEMVDENAAIASQSGLLTDEDKDAVLQMMNENRRLSELYCTGCNYCQPCPQGIVIPRLFELMNYHKVYGITGYAKSEYKSIMDGTAWNKSKTAVDCVECGLCESKCPQKLAVVNQLKETHEALAV